MIAEQELGQRPCRNTTKVSFFSPPPLHNCRIGYKQSAVLSGMTLRIETSTVHIKLIAVVWLIYISIVCLHMSTRSRNVLLTPLQEPRERSPHLVETERERERVGDTRGRGRTWTLAEPWSHRPPLLLRNTSITPHTAQYGTAVTTAVQGLHRCGGFPASQIIA